MSILSLRYTQCESDPSLQCSLCDKLHFSVVAVAVSRDDERTVCEKCLVKLLVETGKGN